MVKGRTVYVGGMGELIRGDSPLSGLPGDAALLIEGPPMTGKYALLLSILAHHSDRIIFISTMHDASRVEADLADLTGCQSLGQVGIIDCVPRPSPMTEPEDPLVIVTGSPENLTRIGVAFTELFDIFDGKDSPEATAVGIHNLSQSLMYAGLKNTYQFLQVLTAQVRSAGWFFAAVIESNAEDAERQTLYHHFDGVVETRENPSGGREFRLRGFSETPSEWTGY